MTTAHTPGLLMHHKLGHPHPDIKALSGRRVAITWSLGKQPKTKQAYEKRTAEDRENARRLVACWNAFDGTPTELIESVDALGTATMPYRLLQASHADLLAALEEIVKNDPYQQSSAGIIARAAIAKAVQP